MRVRLIAAFALASASACNPYNYKVADAHAPKSGLSTYRSVSIEVGAAPGVDTEADDIASFTEDVEVRVRDTKVIANVRRGPTDAELALRVRVTKLEHKESYSLERGTIRWVEALAEVELYDVARGAAVGHFSVTATPGGLLPTPQAKRSMVSSAYSNAARAIASQLKKRR